MLTWTDIFSCMKIIFHTIIIVIICRAFFAINYFIKAYIFRNFEHHIDCTYFGVTLVHKITCVLLGSPLATPWLKEYLLVLYKIGVEENDLSGKNEKPNAINFRKPLLLT